MVTYYREARPPCPGDEQIIALAVRPAAIAIERERLSRLRSRDERLRASFEQVGIATAGTDGRFVQMNRSSSRSSAARRSCGSSAWDDAS
jgi:hypothetical protein